LATAGRRQVALLGRPSNNNRRAAISATMTTSSNSGTNPWETKIIRVSSSTRHRGNNYGAAAAAAGAIALLSSGAYAVATTTDDITLEKTLASVERSATSTVGNILHAAQIATAPSTASSSADAALVTVHPPLLMVLQSMISLGFGGSGEGPVDASASSASVSASQPTQKDPTAAGSSSADGSEVESVGFGLRMRRVREFVSAQEWMTALSGGSVTSSSTHSSHSASRQNPDSYEVSVRALKGGRISMEDEYFLSNEGRFAAVFDGHGGGGVSSYLRDRLYEKFQQHMRTYESDHDESGNHGNNSASYPTIPSQVAAFRLAFDEVEKEVCMNEDLQYQGSTAVAVSVHEDADGTRTLLSANVGDSRAILSRRGRAIDLTRDHKPNDEREKARILGMGEHIEWDHYCKVHRVRNLSLSRAIGDRFAKPAVSGEVEIKRFPVVEDADEFILLASDGLWDVMSSQEVVSFVHKRLDAPLKFGNQTGDAQRAMGARRRNMSRFVANEALKRGSGDNVCVVMVWLKDANK